jgi:hypothetical protein
LSWCARASSWLQNELLRTSGVRETVEKYCFYESVPPSSVPPSQVAEWRTEAHDTAATPDARLVKRKSSRGTREHNGGARLIDFARADGDAGVASGDKVGQMRTRQPINQHESTSTDRSVRGRPVRGTHRGEVQAHTCNSAHRAWRVRSKSTRPTTQPTASTQRTHCTVRHARTHFRGLLWRAFC